MTGESIGPRGKSRCGPVPVTRFARLIGSDYCVWNYVYIRIFPHAGEFSARDTVARVYWCADPGWRCTAGKSRCLVSRARERPPADTSGQDKTTRCRERVATPCRPVVVLVFAYPSLS